MDAEGFLGFNALDGESGFGPTRPVRGHAATRAAIGNFFSSFAAIRHDLQRLDAQDNAIVCEGEVTVPRT